MSALAVGSKLLGIFLLYAGTTYVLTAVLLARDAISAALFQLLGAAVAFAFGLALAFRTEMVLRRIGTSRGEPEDAATWRPREVLRTGIVLIGLYVFVTRIGDALRDVGFWLGGGQFGGIGGAALHAAIALVPLIVAALFVLRADLVVDIIDRNSGRSKAPATEPMGLNDG